MINDRSKLIQINIPEQFFFFCYQTFDPEAKKKVVVRLSNKISDKIGNCVDN